MDAEFRPVRFTLKQADVLQSTSPGASGLTTLHKYVFFMSPMVIPSVSWTSVMKIETADGR
jgi:hypothetical protein